VTRPRTFLLRLWALVRSRQMDRDIDDEIASHLAEAKEEYIQQGLSPQEAHWAALRSFGGVTQTKEAYREVRDAHSGAWIDHLRRDLRFGVRALVRRPAFTCLAVLTIALGIGPTTAIFSVTDSVLFKPLPFPDADRLVAVWEARPHSTALGWKPRHSTTSTGRVRRIAVTPNFMSILEVPPIVGRWFESPDGAPGQPATTVLSYGLWQRRFGSDPRIVGRTIRLNNEPYTIVGVMPRGFQFPRARVQAWVPVDYANGAGSQNRRLFALRVIGRLRPGVSITEATSELGVIAGNLARAYPDNRESSAFAVSLHDDLVGDERTSFLLLLGAAGLVLLIACANVAGLLLTRGASRDAEFAMRAALGASRAQLVRQLLLEGILLSGVGAIAGLLLATRSFHLLNALVPTSLQGTVSMSLDLRLLIFGIAVALLTSVVFGLAPLRYAFQRDLRTALGARTNSTAVAGRRLQALLAVEVALSIVVLFSTGLMLQTILNLETADIGFEKQNVLTARVELAPAEYPTLQHRLNFYGELLERVGSLPGVVSAGLTTFLPYNETIGSGPLRVEGRPDLLDLSNAAYLRAVTPGYFPTLKVPVVAGRGFSERDTADTELVAIVSEGLNAALGGDLIGQRVAFGLGQSDWLRIIGVVGDIRYDGVDVTNSRGALYVPVAQGRESGPVSSFFMPRDLAIRTTGNPMTLASALQKEIWAINPNQPVADIRTLDPLVDGQIADRKVQTGLLSTFSGLALFMAALGVYGLLSFTLAARTRELGVRVALGARGRELVALVSRGSLRWVAAGLVVGIALALTASRAMGSLIYGVEPIDWRSLIASTIVLGLVAIGAALLPVWRATRIDPVVILRAE
jgi:predicted permease